MSDLTTILLMGALLGMALVLGVFVVALRRRDHLRQKGERDGEDRALDEDG